MQKMESVSICNCNLEREEKCNVTKIIAIHAHLEVDSDYEVDESTI